jgi:hypothetical protein
MASHDKKARRMMDGLVFLDESGFLPAPLARHSWAPAGQTAVLYQRRGRHHKKVSAVAALCVSQTAIGCVCTFASTRARKSTATAASHF